MFARRPGGNRRGVGDNVGSSLATILGTNLVEYWDAALGYALVSGEVDTWTGQKQGIVLSALAAGQRPTWTAADATMQNQPTVTTVIAGAHALRYNGGASVLIASGTRPHIVAIGRYSAVLTDAASHNIVECGSYDLGQQRLSLRTDGGGAGDTSFMVNGSVTSRTTFASADTLAHVFEGFTSSTDVTVGFDLFDTTDPDDVNLSSNITTVSLGVACVNNTQTMGFVYAWVGLCLAEIPAAQRDLLATYSRARWGTL